MLQTYIHSDEDINLSIVGKIVTSRGSCDDLKIENAHIITCCLKMGSQSIDNFGKPVKEECWSSCDYNERKSAVLSTDNILFVEKNGVSFNFRFNKENEMLYLKSIIYKLTVLPKM